MKKLIIGDIHCKKSSIDTVEEVLEKCKLLATKCDLTIFTGDVNDTKANIRSETIELLLRMFSNWPTPIIIYLGNHDYNNSIECQGHSLEFLKGLTGVTLIEKPTEIDGDFFVPYMPEDKFVEFMESNQIPAKHLYLHQDMDWAKYSSGQPTNSLIKYSLFADFHRVFVGHIHKAQEFKNIIYVGTPYTESFKESDEKKSVIVYDQSNDKVLRIPLGVRQHVTFEFTINEINQVKEIKKKLKKDMTDGQLVRVIINAPEEIEPKIKRSLFEDMAIESFKTNAILSKDKEVKVTETMSEEDVMDIYFKQLDISADMLYAVKALNTEILKNLGGTNG